MNRDIRWLAPAALMALTPQCIAAKYMTLEQAQKLIFTQADAFVETPVTLSPDQVRALDKLCGVPSRSPKQQVWQALEQGRLLGWFVIDQVIGKHELITYAAGINADGSVRQIQIIEYLEAYGYQVRARKWRDQFIGKTADDTLRVGSDIGNIAGATLSTHHITDGVRRLLHLHRTALR